MHTMVFPREGGGGVFASSVLVSYFTLLYHSVPGTGTVPGTTVVYILVLVVPGTGGTLPKHS